MRKIIFVSTFDYPTRYAHARHGLEMARAYNGLPNTEFLFFVNTARESLPVPYVRLFGAFGRRIKKLGLRSVLVPIRIGLFLCTHPSWRSAIVITTDPGLYSTMVRLKRIFGFRLLVECHGSLTETQEQALTKADCAVFTTIWLKNRYGKALKNICAPNAVDIVAFDAVHDDQAKLRADLSLPRDVLLIGYIGRFEPLGMDKGLHFLIDTLDAEPDAHLLFVGGSPQEVPKLQAYVAGRGLAARVHIVGLVDAAEVPRYAKACDVLAYVPTENASFFTRETSPMKVFEYMAARRPIILSDTPALREILSDDAAFFIQQSSRAGFAAALTALQNGDGESRTDRAYERVRGNTWDARARMVVQELERVL